MSNQHHTIAVLIPCYNEKQTIGKVVRDFRAALPGASIYVYDNCSTDGTAKAAEAAGAVVHNEYRQGKGHVIRRMFREIEADCYLLVDGDDTYEASDAPAMVREVLEGQADMVVGDRLSGAYFAENKRGFHNAGNRLVRFMINRLFGCRIRDIMTGYRAFSYQFVKSFPVLSKGFEIETEMTIHAVDKNMAVSSLPVGYRDRPEGSVSKLNTLSDGLAVLRTILRLWKGYRPFWFFGTLSALFLVLDAGLFLPAVLVPYLKTGLVQNFPTLMVCGFGAVACITAFFAGMILDVLNEKERQAFEFRLQMIQKKRRNGTWENR